MSFEEPAIAGRPNVAPELRHCILTPPMMGKAVELSFENAVEGLKRGDFSRLEPLFEEGSALDGSGSRIVEWYKEGLFADEPMAISEALSCACFNGRTKVAAFLLEQGVDLAAGDGTGLNAFHWAANRGQLEAVKLLIQWQAPLEIENSYGGTVLGCAVYSAVHESKASHLEIIGAPSTRARTSPLPNIRAETTGLTSFCPTRREA